MKHETKVQKKEGLRLTKGKHITPLIWKYAYMTETDLLCRERDVDLRSYAAGPGIIGPRSCDECNPGAPRGRFLFPHTFLPNSCRVP